MVPHLLASLEATIAVVEFAVSGLLFAIATRLTGGSAPNRRRIGAIRMARAIVRLIHHRHRLRHLPTLGQVRAMAWLDGREPCSYLLDPRQNFVPEPLDSGYEHELGRHALNFTLGDDEGYFVTEMVAMRDGGMFSLLAC